MLHTHQTIVLPDGRIKEWEGPLDETDYDRKRHNWLKKRKITDEDVRNQGTPTNRLCTIDSGYDPINGMAIQSAIPVAVVKA